MDEDRWENAQRIHTMGRSNLNDFRYQCSVAASIDLSDLVYGGRASVVKGNLAGSIDA
jgi:hypothetical protein